MRGRTLACALVAIAAIAACGGAEDPPDIPATVRAGAPLEVAAREYVFAPNRVTVRDARGPVRQRIVLRNRGELAHNVELLDGDRVVGKLRGFPAGEQGTLTVELRPGEYRFVCTVADHDEKGMRGTLTVR
jgi:plastocyanin